jgi:DNA (cytosine-5)-methyltransferase 1
MWWYSIKEKQLNELALFAGAGGGLLASKLEGFRIVCYVEWNKYAVEVIKSRIRDGYLDDAPIWDDCFSFDGRPWTGSVDIVSAGFPCQPFSSAGKGLSEADTRNGWPATIRIIDQVRPTFAWLENVPGLISKPYIRRIFGDLAEIGYDAEWGCLSAASVGAPHKRERLWIVAYDNSGSWFIPGISRQSKETLLPLWNGNTQSMAYPDQIGCKGKPRKEDRKREVQNKFSRGGKEISHTNINHVEEPSDKQAKIRNQQGGWWTIEPGLGRVANGVAHRMDRLETIGNGQVPEVARTAWKLLMMRLMEIYP